ncbi:MAG: MBL fold metallo-hydrolase [Gammaproteobacteria bacterium]|jgi:glyoxylase-like metal-dependent hydrolase (beta-lactamase superfamily II)|nr:MBL fold metallo-hydrolase [Gammaproteobacteria bacterium]
MRFFLEEAVEYGIATTVAPGIRRVMANNPGPFTYHGTGTYIVGSGNVAVIDPGPSLTEHVDALVSELEGERVEHILITHTHLDHSPAAALLKNKTGSPTYGFGPHGADKGPAVEEGADYNFVPDIALLDGHIIEGDGYTFEAIHTPGHTSNHVCFELKGTGILFSGDHVMGWSTTVVSPPDGDMAVYRASLKSLIGRDNDTYLPTHGPKIIDPQSHLNSLIAHRDSRESSILDCLENKKSKIHDIVKELYKDLDPRLHKAAQRSILAHLIQLINEGKITADNANVGVNSEFKLR